MKIFLSLVEWMIMCYKLVKCLRSSCTSSFPDVLAVLKSVWYFQKLRIAGDSRVEQLTATSFPLEFNSEWSRFIAISRLSSILSDLHLHLRPLHEFLSCVGFDITDEFPSRICALCARRRALTEGISFGLKLVFQQVHDLFNCLVFRATEMTLSSWASSSVLFELGFG